MKKVIKNKAILLMSLQFNFLTNNFIPKNTAKNIKAKIVSDVWVNAVAESAVPINM